MEIDLEKLPQIAKGKRKENNKFFKKLKKKPPKKLDSIMQKLHEDEFSKTDCLDCANCCKTTGPLFTKKDIHRLSRLFKMKENQFIAKYLQLDEEKDYVLQTLPCPFLGVDNKCLIYDQRPKACAEFPHTDRKNFHQITNLTKKNIEVCPAAFRIVEAMKERIQG
jgi:hypothetical protein